MVQALQSSPTDLDDRTQKIFLFFLIKKNQAEVVFLDEFQGIPC